jgi:hypothetical protein
MKLPEHSTGMKGRGFLDLHPDYQRRYLEIAQKYAKITTITMEGGADVLPDNLHRIQGAHLLFVKTTNLPI